MRINIVAEYENLKKKQEKQYAKLMIISSNMQWYILCFKINEFHSNLNGNFNNIIKLKMN
jgi:hypothetical protein